MTTINLVTAVSRPENLPRIFKSIELSLWDSPLQCRWILVADERLPFIPVRILELAEDSHVHVTFEVLAPTSEYGIAQKNLGIDLVEEGFFYCLDDDNILHPAFFERLGKAISENPGKMAFAFNQQRWDHWGSLKASPETFEPNKVDNAMFVAHKHLIGNLRYRQVGCEDYVFYRTLFDVRPEAFLFLDETLCFYNFLRRG